MPGAQGPGTTLGGVVNTYYPATADAAAGDTSILVGTSRGAATAIAAGDLLLVMQMQDAQINSTNTNSYGSGVSGDPGSGSTNINNSGVYEYVRATGPVAAGAVPIAGAGTSSGLVNSYFNAAASGTRGQRRFQVIRLPQYSSATLGSTLTAAAWNGTSGGILAFDVAGTLALGSATVDVTALGFRGGGGRQLTGANGGSATAYRTNATINYHASKGEGIAGTPRYVRNGTAAATNTGVEGYPNGSNARGAPGTAGGGGNDSDTALNQENGGGGGGANAGTGGQGGNTWNDNSPYGGHGGVGITPTIGRVLLGGGGGAGSRNNSPTIAAASAGGNGGGIVMIRAGLLTGTGTITADGQTGVTPQNDGGGGGGAGGSIMVLSSGGGLGGLTANARGAIGGDAEQASGGSPHGPGGGGGGGTVILSGAPAGASVLGGGAGDTTNGSGGFITYGAQPGSNGTTDTAALLASVPGVSSGAECLPQLTTTKTTSTANLVDTGVDQTATYTITVSNSSTRGTAENVNISDALPSGFTYSSTTTVALTGGATRPTPSDPTAGSSAPAWGTFTIPGGGQVQITFNVSVATGTTPGTYQNPATATYTDPTRTLAGGTTTSNYVAASSTGEDVSLRLPVADVRVTKTASTTTPVLNGNVTFTVTAINDGPELARSVSVSDLLPTGLTFVSATPSTGTYTSGTGVWAVGNMANGATETLSIVATATTTSPVTNTATITTASSDPTPTNDSASVDVDVQEADLSVTKSTSSATPTVGSNVTFTIGLTNEGANTAQSVVVTDLLPTGLSFVSATPSVGTYNSTTGQWTVGSLANGASESLSLVATVVGHTLITNTASVVSTTYDPDLTDNSDSVDVNAPDADLEVTKSVDNATPDVGDNVVFTVAVRNAGADTAAAVQLSDLLPAGLTYVSHTASVGTYTSGTGAWVIGSLNNGVTATLTITATVDSHLPLTNTANVTSTTFDPDSTDNSDTADVDALNADLAVTKSVDNATPALNGTVVFSVGVSNAGPDAAQSVVVSDLLPAGLSFVSATPSVGTYTQATGAWAVGTLATGASATLSITATVTSPALITNTASVTSTTHDPAGANNDASVDVDVPEADVEVTKTVDISAPSLGSNVVFTVGVRNAGPNTAVGVSVADTLPAGLTLVSATPSTGSYAAGVWTVGDMASGATATLTITATVTVHTARTNTATATSSTHDPDTLDNSASATVNVPDADLTVTKTVDTATPALNGTVNFLVTVVNDGPDAASAVTVDDLLPAGLGFVSATASAGTYDDTTGVWTVGAVPAGQTRTLAVAATVTTHTAVTNTADATSGTHDPNPADNGDSATVNVPDADLVVAKTVNDPAPEIGDNVTFTVTLTNNGPDAAQAVVVDDLLPAGLSFVSATPSAGTYVDTTGEWTIGAVPASGVHTLDIVARVTAPGTITNTATATSTTYDPTPGNNGGSTQVNGLQADLAVTKSVDNATATVGSTVTFTVAITNSGPNAASGVAVDDVLPSGLTLQSASASTGSYAAGVWTIGSLSGGASATLTITATVDTHTPQTNTATARATTYDPDPANNSDDATVDAPDADLRVTKSVSNATPVHGTNVDFTVLVENLGTNDAANVAVADTLPGGLTFVSASTTTGTYTAGTGQWAIGTLPASGSATLTITATVATHLPVLNTATVTSTTHDPVAGNDSDTAGVDAPDADVSLVKSVDVPRPTVGSTVTFDVTIANAGADDATGVAVTDVVPAGLTVISTSATAGTYSGGTWTVGTLANGVSESLTIVATVDVHTEIVNTASVVATTFDPDLANNTDDARVDAFDADIQVTKTVDTATPTVGSDVTYTVTVANAGSDVATATQVTDLVPGGLTLVSATPSAGTYTPATGLWTVGDLAALGTETLTIVATVTGHSPITNTAAGTSSTHDPLPGNNTDAVAIDAPDADIAITKTVDQSAPALGSNVTFTVTASNTGTDTAVGVSVADALPPGLALVSATPSLGSYLAGTWTIGGLAAGMSETLTIVATVTTYAAVTNTATISSSTYDPTPGDHTDQATVNVPDADLQVTKAVDVAAPNVGDQVEFTITVTNAGPSPAASVVVADALPGGLTLVGATPSTGTYAAGVWTVGNMISGATETLTVRATVDVHSALTNTATVSSATLDPVSGNDSDAASVDALDADLSVTKTVDQSAPTLGSNVTFTVTVENLGADDAQTVSVADALPAGLTLVSATPSTGTYAAGVWTVGTVPAFGSATLTIVASVDVPTPRTNTATATTTTFDPNGANDTDAASVDVPDADLAVVKVVDNATAPYGTDVEFTVTVTNTGPSDAQSVAVADALPSGLSLVSASPSAGSYAAGVWTIGTLNASSSASLVIRATVGSYAPQTNVASVSSTTLDPVPGNNSDDATVDAPAADLAVTKVVDDATPSLNDVVRFTITLENLGTDVATATSVADALPGGLSLVTANASVGSYAGGVWTVGDLAAGASETLTIDAEVTSHLMIVNTATATSAVSDPVPANNADQAVVNVPDANLQLSKVASSATPAVGSDVDFTITLTNNGPDDAVGVVVADALPGGLTLVSATPSQGTYVAGSWNVGTVTNTSTVTLVIRARVDSHVAITNTATATATTFDPDTTNNTDAAGIDAPDADLAVTKVVDNNAPLLGEVVRFTVTVQNLGPDSSAGVSIADALPSGLTMTGSSTTQGTYAAGVWNVGSLANLATATLTIDARVDVPGGLTNTATASATTYDPNPANDSAFASVGATEADLSVDKSVDVAAPALNGTVVFTVTVTNGGPDNATGVRVDDMIPAGLADVVATPSTGTYDSGTGVWTIGTLAPAGTATMTISARVTTHLPVTNTAQVASDVYDPVPANNTDAAIVDVPDANLQITKGADTLTPTLGGNVTFDLTVTNTGPNDAVGVTVADTLPPGLTFVSATPAAAYNDATGVWTIGTLANGAVTTLQITARVDDHLAITNTATVDATTHDPVPGDDIDSVTIDAPDADVQVTKSVSNSNPALGATVVFTVVVTNGGPDTATAVTVSDMLPGSLSFVSSNPGTYNPATGVWNAGDLASGASATLQITATVNGVALITNTASATSSVFDPVLANNTDDATVDAPDADLSINKSIDAPAAGPYLNGADLTYRVTVTNAGPETAVAPVITDSLPAGVTFVSADAGCSAIGQTVTCTLADLASGATASRLITVTANQAGTITNTASVGSATPDGDLANNSTSLDTTITPVADLAITKAVTTPAGPFLNGEELTYTVTVTNSGPDTAVAPIITDTLPAQVTFVSASAGCSAVGQVVTCMLGDVPSTGTAAVAIMVRADATGTITNTASVASTTTDTNLANNATSLDTTIVPAADLAITKVVSAPAAPLHNGQNLTYAITVTNNGPDTAVAPVVTDTLPGTVTLVSAPGCTGTTTLTCVLADLASGASANLTVTVRADATGTITNSASVASTTADPDASNNTTSVDATIVASADLSVSKTVVAPVAPPYLTGNALTYELTVSNAGPDVAVNTVLTDTLPTGVTVISLDAGCTESGGIVTCALGDVPAGGTSTVQITVMPGGAGTITNAASVASTTADPNLTDNATSIDTPITAAQADLSIAKAVTNPVGPFLNGQELTYTLTIRNDGPHPALTPTVVDTLPTEVTFVSASAGCAESGVVVTCGVPTLASGDVISLNIRVRADQAATITNTASVSSTTPDPDATDNSTSINTTIAPVADLAISKTVTSPAAGPYLNGELLTYTLVVTNAGPDAAVLPTVTDTLPAGVSYVSDTAGCSAAGQVLSCPMADLASGASASFTVTVRATTAGVATNVASVVSATHDPNTVDNSTSVDTTITPAADLQLAKSVTAPAVGPYLNGYDLTYTVTVTNNGPDAAVAPVITDTLPGATTFVSAAAGCAEAAGIVTCTLADLTAGASTNVTVTVTANSSGTITNTASVTSATADPDGSNNSASVDVTVVPVADLAIAKSVTSPAAGPYLNGQDLTYTLTVTNNGPDTAVAPVVTDTLPGAVTFVSATAGCSEAAGVVTCALADLASGASTLIAVTVTPTSAGTVTNTASVTSTTADDDVANNTASVDTTVVAAADLEITKTVASPAPLLNGQNVTYTLTVANNGPDTAVAPVVTDVLPAGVVFVSAPGCSEAAGTVTCTLPDVASGGSVALALTVRPTVAGGVTNTASVSSVTADPDTLNNVSSVGATIVPAADLSVAKVVSAPAAGPYLNGQNLTYTVTVTNNGPDTAVTPVITDTLPASTSFVSASAGCVEAAGTVTCSLADLATGASVAVTVMVTANSAGTITNAASVTSTTADPDASNNSASVDTPIAAVADVAITKAVTSPAVGPYLNGQDLTYTLTVTNNGPDVAVAPVVTDTLPGSVTFVSASAGCTEAAGVVTCALADIPVGGSTAVTVTATATTAGTITNTASVASATILDPVPANNTASVDTTIAPAADLGLAKSVTSAAPYLNGHDLTYTLTVTNNGPDTAVAPTITDTLPGATTFVSASAGCFEAAGTVTCVLADVSAGASRSVTITVTANTAGTITNVASVASTTADPNPVNDTASVDTTITPVADLAITKSVTTPAAGPYLNGQDLTYTLTVTNNGPDTAVAPVITDTLPVSAAFVTAAAGCVEAAGVVTCTLGDLPSGATSTSTVTVRPTATGTITNTASVTSTTADDDAANNTAAVDAAIVGSADLTITKTVSAPAAAPYLNGQDLTYELLVENLGPDVAVAPTITDTLPVGTTFVSASAGCSFAAGAVTCTLADLPAGSLRVVNVTVRPTAAGDITNTASVASSTADPDTLNNVDSVTTTIAPAADLSIGKSVSAPAAGPYLTGQNLTYTITVTNNGPDTATAPTITDVLPAGVTFVASAGCVETAGTLTCVLLDLAPGASGSVTVTVNPTVAGVLANTADVTSVTADPVATNNTDTASTPIVEPTDLGIALSVLSPAGPYVNGQPVTYRATITNNGPGAAVAPQVQVTLPAGQAIGSTPAGCSVAGQVVTCTLADLANGASTTIDIVATPSTTGLQTIDGSVATASIDTNPANDADSLDITVVPAADLAIAAAVQAPAGPYLNGQDLTYRLTVTNNGPDTATAPTVTFTLPAGVTFVSGPAGCTEAAGVVTCLLADLPSGDTVTRDIVVTATAPGTHTAAADVTSITADPVLANNATTVDVTIVAAADLSLTKTVDNATPNVGQDVNFTITVSNAGPDTATGVTVQDLLPAGFTFVTSDAGAAYDAGTGTWTTGDILPGAANAATIVITATVAPTGPWTNVAQVATSNQADPDSTPGGGPATEDDRDAVTVDPQIIDLDVAVAVNTPTPIIGGTVVATITLRNDGPDAATAVTVAPTLPAGLTLASDNPAPGTTFAAGVWTIPTLAAGSSVTLQLTLDATALGVATIEAEVTAAGQFDSDSTPADLAGDDYDTVIVDVLAASADLSLSKSVSNASPTVGATVDYALTLQNAGPSTATNVSVVDLLPAGISFVTATATAGAYDSGSGLWTVGNVPNGGTETLTISVTADTAGPVVNVAEVAASDVADPDSTPANASGTEDDEATASMTIQAGPPPPPPPAMADLEIAKSTSATSVAVGDVISYAIVLTNNGPGTATNAQVAELLPPALQITGTRVSTGSYDTASGIWTVPSLASGTAATLVVTTRVVGLGSVTNVAQVIRSDQPDPDGPFSSTPGVGETAEATIEVRGTAVTPTRLSIVKTGPATVKAGGTVTFTIRVRNTGTVPATNVVLVDCVPTGMHLTTIRNSGKLKHGRIGWPLGTLQPGETRVVRVVLRTDRDARGLRGCAASASAANATTVRDGARVRIVAGATRRRSAPVTG